MDIIQLKAPPYVVSLMIQSLERDIEAEPDRADTGDRKQLLAWLRYRLAKFNGRTKPHVKT